jgi:predicted PurR-regulated permease PerM
MPDDDRGVDEAGTGTAGAVTSAADTARGNPAEPIEVDLDWQTVAIFLAAFVALVAFTSLVHQAGPVVAWVTIGTLLALALDPLVTSLARRVRRRSVAVGVVLTGFVAVVVLLAVVFGPPAARQAQRLSEDLPQVIHDLGDLPIVGHRLRDANVDAKVQDFLDNLPERLSGDTTPLERAGRSVLSGALAAGATTLVAIALLLDGERLLRRIRRLVPVDRRDRADQFGRLAYQVIGRYFAGSVLVAVIAGVSVTAVGLILGVPLAPLLGAWVALFDLVPQIGGAAGGIPFVALALTKGPTVGLIAAVFFVLYLQFENHLLSPLVVGRSVNLSPPATLTAALVGVSTGGVVGALVAVPLLGAAKAIFLELRPSAADPEDLRRARRIWARRQSRGAGGSPS